MKEQAITRGIMALIAMAGGPAIRGDVVGNDVCGDYEIDTCDTIDAGYETAVKRGPGHWAIVEHYSDAESALAGHKKWLKIIKEDSPTSVYECVLEEHVTL